MEDQYGISDLRQFINRATVPQYPPFPQQPSLPPSSDLFSAHHHHCGLSPPAPAQYEMVVMGRSMSDMLHHSTTSSGAFHRHKEHQHQLHFNSDSTTTTATATTNSRNSGGFDGGDGGAARWPRQETLTLLEIRSKLDHKFKEANQKGPLWDEVARIMSEEHGYQRTGKKCREKFENLYKYYKKTKEGKAGRQDGKHYRFFRQLEALYGEHHTHHHTITSTSDAHHFAGNVPHFHDNSVNIIQSKLATSDNHQMLQPASVSLSNSSDYETSSSDDDDVGGSIESDDSSKKKKKKKRRGKRSWKAKVKEFIDHQMRKIMEKQEAWLEKMMKTMESREMERIEREEEWRKKEVERMEREHKFWASERAWIEARDSALMNALEKLTNTREREVNEADHHHRCRSGIIHPDNQWLETEVTRLIQLRTSMESRFQQCGFSEEVLWEDIAAKMAYLGYDRSAIVCKEKWDSLNKSYFQEKDNIIRDNEGCKKRKENYGEVSNNSYNTTTNNSNNHNEGGLCMNQMGGFGNNCEINETRLQLNEEASSPSSHNSNANVNLKANVNASSSVGVGVGGGGGGGGGGASVMNDGCLRFFLGDCSDGLGWESTSYGLKLNNGGNQCA